MKETRLDDIEAKLAHQEVAVSDLNDVIYRQQKQLDQLEMRYQRLLQRLQQLQASSGKEVPEEGPPPHY